MSFPNEILLGYGAMALACELCGMLVETPGNRLCDSCEEEESRRLSGALGETEDEDEPAPPSP